MKRTRQSTVEMVSPTQRRDFAPKLFRACRTYFQLPQAILAGSGNWLIPKRKAVRAKRCSKAGDGSADRTRVLCLALPLSLRDRRHAKVYPYGIGIARTSASPIAICFESMPSARKPDSSNKTRTHPGHSPATSSTSKFRVADSRFEERGQRSFYQQCVPNLRPNHEYFVVFMISVVRASRFTDGL